MRAHHRDGLIVLGVAVLVHQIGIGPFLGQQIVSGGALAVLALLAAVLAGGIALDRVIRSRRGVRGWPLVAVATGLIGDTALVVYTSTEMQ